MADGTDGIFAVSKAMLAASEPTVPSASALSICDRRYHGRLFRRCFLGNAAVDWLLAQGHAATREQGVALGAAMGAAGLLAHVTRGHTFKDAPLFYRFEQPVVEAAAKSARAKPPVLISNERGVQLPSSVEEAHARQQRQHQLDGSGRGSPDSEVVGGASGSGDGGGGGERRPSLLRRLSSARRSRSTGTLQMSSAGAAEAASAAAAARASEGGGGGGSGSRSRGSGWAVMRAVRRWMGTPPAAAMSEGARQRCAAAAALRKHATLVLGAAAAQQRAVCASCDADSTGATGLPMQLRARLQLLERLGLGAS